MSARSSPSQPDVEPSPALAWAARMSANACSLTTSARVVARETSSRSIDRFCSDAGTSPASTGLGCARDLGAGAGLRVASARRGVGVGVGLGLRLAGGAAAVSLAMAEWGVEESMIGTSCPPLPDACPAALGAGGAA